ncbi:rRNA maturation RNase YbeY [Paucihalobacter ruber]|uniref:Endoribonuclease YbeY n=1 Tax=Paucihalobacter ruber TaxID=2567861 RepID=A0A506PNY2_9FLAO|nr:rRNA maturation RNase YbeY [Paucihalobacter ruber]TPV34935.1 rRNA maturation RNase YbeY [Paucihalobacter ruber]
MINFFAETEFQLKGEDKISAWINNAITAENKIEGEINFIFVNDDYLLDLNEKFLNHDTLTDIITFDNSVGNILHADIYISTERVQDNATDFKVSFQEELHRVMIHGVLHLAGYGDKTDDEVAVMRARENHYLERL